MTDQHDIFVCNDRSGDELGAYLAAVARDDCYRVVRPLGAATRRGGDASASGQAGTVTELVQFEGANGAALGPFVRKRIDLALGVGAAYQELYDAQRDGARFVHVPRIVECYKTGRELVVVSEYIPGDTLETFVRSAGPSLELALEVVPAVCAAVAELHAALDPPIVHRDLKPANVIVSRGSAGMVATLIDFGIARRYREGAAADTVRFGTRAYAPPEQFGFGQTSVRSDVYALGMIAQFCITGEEPKGQPTAESLARAGVTGAYAEAILQATSFDPERRFANAEAFGTAFMGEGQSARGLGEAAGGKPVLSPASVPPFVPARSGERSEEGGVPAGSNGQSQQMSAARRPRSIGLGHAKNIALLLVAVMFVVVATQAVGDPVGGQEYPLWYTLYLTYVFCLPLILGIIYLLLDRDSLARVAPRAAAFPRKRAARNLAIYLTIAFAGGVLLNLFL